MTHLIILAPLDFQTFLRPWLLKCGSSHIIAILVEFRIWGQLDGKMEDISLMMTKEAKQAPG